MVDKEAEEFLEHYGIKGMHWGVRKGKSKTGVGRARGAVIDYNDRQVDKLQRMKKGKNFRIQGKIGRKVLGEKDFNKRINMNTILYKDQNKRLMNDGKLNVNDRLTVIGRLSPVTLVTSYRPK